MLKIFSISEFAHVYLMMASIISRPAGKHEGASTEHPAPTKKVNPSPSIRSLNVKVVSFIINSI